MPSRPLSADRTLEVRLHTRAGTLASAVARGVTTRGQAVAALSLIAPCRPELTERVRTRVGSVPPADVEWPPRSMQLALLASSFRVAQGDVRLTGPGGVTVQHVTYTDKLGYTRRVLRLERHGVPVGDFRSVEELGRHVDVATLREDEH
jgi:thioesterase domain-containing protein